MELQTEIVVPRAAGTARGKRFLMYSIIENIYKVMRVKGEFCFSDSKNINFIVVCCVEGGMSFSFPPSYVNSSYCENYPASIKAYCTAEEQRTRWL